MPALNLSQTDHERVFGPRLEARKTGRSRRCKVCGDWHRLDRPWPHNCRSEAPPRADFATPMIAPAFQPFRTGVTEMGEIINNRHDKREYMARNNLVEYDDGVQPDTEPSEQEQKREFSEQITRFEQTDPLNIKPVDRVGETDTDGAGDIDATEIEVAK